jgi:signal transduction histidine kinase
MFHSTRLKLTAWYLVIIMLVSISFSLVIYGLLSAEVQRFATAQRFRIERSFPDRNFTPPPAMIVDPDLLNETRQRIALMLSVVNCGIFVISGALGYFLAGRTLQPIGNMVDEQNRFISDASHQLRTPLTALKSTMEVNLRDKQLNLGGAKKLIVDSLGEVDKLQALSDSLLRMGQYQKPGSGDGAKMEKLNPADVVKEAVKKVRPLADNKHIKITANSINQVIDGNKFALEELLTILLDNAVKYSPDKTEVQLNIKRIDGQIVITVSDRGAGIGKKDLPHIFERFYRADNSRLQTGAKGYGLGLSIAKQITDMHYGSIGVNSMMNKGTTFTVRLPVDQSGQSNKSSLFKQIFSLVK